LPKFPFTKQQKKAVNNLSGNLQVIACAGSGKTEVVSSRIAELVKKGEKPASIVAFTFTEKAAEELKARIRSILDRECPSKADLGDMYVGTIHSFCFEMLKELEPHYRGYDVLDEPKRVAFLAMPRRYNYSNLPQLEDGGKFHTILEFSNSYDILRMENVNPSDLSNKDFRRCCNEYDAFLDRDRFLDFTSMIYRLVDLLEKSKDARKRLHEKVQHLIVDEYQDVDPLQEKLIKLISKGGRSLCVVGDDDQCVYNWRGSTVDNIINFPKNYHNVITVPIPHNFRSTSQIIDCAKNFIRHNKRRLRKEMKPSKKQANKPQNDDLFYTHFDTEDDEFSFIVDRIGALSGTDFCDKKGTPFSLSYGDFAILTRKRDEAAKIVRRLDEEGIDCVLDIGEEVFNRPEVVLSLKCLAYLFNLSFEDNTVTSRELMTEYTTVFPKREYPKSDARRFVRILGRMKKAVRKIMATGKRGYLAYGLQPYFHEIIQAFGADRFEFRDVYNYNLAILSRAIADYESVWIRLRASEVKYFFGFVEGYGKHSYADTSHNDPALINAVKVLTIHRAKGLEFPVVFIPSFVKERHRAFGGTLIDEKLYDVAKYEGDIEDERRVYYTAITRSMKYLFITGSAKRKKKDGTPYKRPAAFEPHPFMGELAHCANFSHNAVITRKRSGYPARKISGSIFPTSFSDINCYRRCGYDYLLRNIYGYQAGVPPAFGYGTRLHNILNIIYKDFITSKKIPDEPSIDGLFDKYFFLRYATTKITDNLKKAGKRVIKNYVMVNKTDFTKVLETEKRFELVLGEALITGQIDLLKKLDEKGNVKEVEIIDFKTEKETDDLYKKDYELQLRLYAIACLRSLGLNPKRACIHHLDRKHKRQKEYVKIAPLHLEKATKEASHAISRIIDRAFTPKPSRNCVYCDWQKICSRK